MKNAFPRGLVAALSLILVLAAGTLAAEDKPTAAPVTSTSAFKLTGYTQARFGLVNDDYATLFNNSGPTSFQVYRARFGLEGEIVKNISFKVVVDAVKSPILVDAMIDFNLIKGGFLRAGQFKVPFSQENLISASQLDTINFAQVVTKLVPGRDIKASGRDIGVMADYKWGTLEGMVGLFNGQGINTVDLDAKKDIAARLTWAPLSYLSVGVSEYLGHSQFAANVLTVKRDRTGLEAAFNYSDFMVKAEYVKAWDGVKTAYGWYVTGGYFALPKQLQLILRYDSYDKSLQAVGDRSDLVVLGCNWFFSSKTKFQINCELGKLESKNLVFSALLGQFQVGF
jgi:phosphate-selective porin